MSSRTAAASCVFMYFSFLPAAFFGAPPPMKDIVRRKALQSAPRSGRIFASEGALGDLWAVCRVVKSTARACPYGRLGQTPNLPEVECAMPAKAHNNHRDTPRKSNGTTRAGRCTDASPARQARINSPEQSLKHRCQAGPGRLNRPAVLEQCPRLRWLGCAVLRSSWPHGDSKPLLFAPHTWSALSWRQRSHCVQHAPGLCRRRASVSSTVAE